ncbi:MAG: sensor histidine kinase [Flavobacteriales bacterium]
MKTVYRIKRLWKWLFLGSALGIAILTFFYSSSLISELKIEEAKRIKIWSKAQERVANLHDDCADAKCNQFDLLIEILQSNTHIPIIIHNETKDEISHYLNIDGHPSDKKLREMMTEMASEHPPISSNETKKDDVYELKIYYTTSTLTNRLKILPIFLIATFSFFVALAYWAFSASRKSEQSLVWAGMARETAHQIGTPLSSLLGWFELLKIQALSDQELGEIQKDLNRLQVITDRFSKIGSQPGLTKENIVPVVRNAYQYLRKRASKKIDFDFQCTEDEIVVESNKVLISWVIENLIRNAIDAIQGKGQISVHLFTNKTSVYIDISDSGKGIKSSDFNTVFEPGFTTKTRGWGLGLSLVKRIIASYHQGEVYVLKSELNIGTSFRVILKKAN